MWQGLQTITVSKTFKQVNWFPGHVLWTSADNLASLFTDIFNLSPSWVCDTNMFQADQHSPCAEEYWGNLPKWLPTSSTHVCSNDVLWKAGQGSHQHHHSRNPRTTPICIPPQQIHRWCNLYCTPHCPFPPGQNKHHSAKLPAIQDLYTRQCQSKALNIVKDSSYPSYRLFSLLSHGKQYRSTKSRFKCSNQMATQTICIAHPFYASVTLIIYAVTLTFYN